MNLKGSLEFLEILMRFLQKDKELAQEFLRSQKCKFSTKIETGQYQTNILGNRKSVNTCNVLLTGFSLGMIVVGAGS